MNNNKLLWSYAALLMGLILVIFADPLAKALVPYRSMGANMSFQSDDSVKFWANAIKYSGGFGLVMGLVERILYSVELRAHRH